MHVLKTNEFHTGAYFKVGGRKIRGRQYPWGIVDIENTEQSDFKHLKRFLIQTHMQVKNMYVTTCKIYAYMLQHVNDNIYIYIAAQLQLNMKNEKL